MMNNKEIEYTARPIPGDYEGRSHRACVWYNRACAAFDLATLDALTTAADKAADRVPTEAYEKARKLLDSVQRWGLADARAWELDNDSRYYNSQWLNAPDNEAYISAGDFVQLINLYRYCKRYDIQNDWINPNGKNTEV